MLCSRRNRLSAGDAYSVSDFAGWRVGEGRVRHTLGPKEKLGSKGLPGLEVDDFLEEPIFEIVCVCVGCDVFVGDDGVELTLRTREDRQRSVF